MAVSGPERDSGLPFEPDDFLFGGLVALTHDLGEIRRVTELDIEQALARSRDNGDFAETLRLIQARASERPQHMIKGAEAARSMLDGHAARFRALIDPILAHIALHDAIKLGVAWPRRSDWRAVCCVEADVEWPLSTEYPGPLADLQRHGVLDPSRDQLRKQAADNLRTQLKRFRASFPAFERFADEETVIRTSRARAFSRHTGAIGESRQVVNCVVDRNAVVEGNPEKLQPQITGLQAEVIRLEELIVGVESHVDRIEAWLNLV